MANNTFSLATLKPNPHSRPKRVRIGRGHGSGMVKTGGEGGKGQTVRSGGGRRLPDPVGAALAAA
jgi:large subunit ribosomal protein L15